MKSNALPDINAMLSIVVLAAGNGSRMQSNTPKVLQHLAGKPLLQHVVDTATQLQPKQIIVVQSEHAHLAESVTTEGEIVWMTQSQPLGTGHAAQQSLPQLVEPGRVLILYGDVPLISAATLTAFCRQTPAEHIGILTAQLDDPKGLGRIIRDSHGQVTQIVEEKDASTAQRKITEINTGILLMPVDFLKTYLPKLSNVNAQQEYYLTDLIVFAVQHSVQIHTQPITDRVEIMGVNTKLQLIQLERTYQQRLAHQYIQAGCHIVDPLRFDCRGSLQFGKDVFIDVNVVLRGNVRLGNHVTIEPNCLLKNVTIGDHVTIAANTIIEESQIAEQAVIGPFARIRPDSSIGAYAKIGNFVEVKKSIIGAYSKASHLSYLGDAIIGDKVNIGAGSITVNYDGAEKFQTIIEEGVFIGCGSQLIAPVTLHKNAFVAAGTTVTKDVPAGTLSLSRVPQKMIDGWVPPSQRKEK